MINLLSEIIKASTPPPGTYSGLVYTPFILSFLFLLLLFFLTIGFLMSSNKRRMFYKILLVIILFFIMLEIYKVYSNSSGLIRTDVEVEDILMYNELYLIEYTHNHYFCIINSNNVNYFIGSGTEEEIKLLSGVSNLFGKNVYYNTLTPAYILLVFAFVIAVFPKKNSQNDNLIINSNNKKLINEIDLNIVGMKSLTLFTSSVYTTLRVNKDKKIFFFDKNNQISKRYNFKDIALYEVYENGNLVLKSNDESNLGINNMFKNDKLTYHDNTYPVTTNNCNDLKVIIILDDYETTHITLQFIDNFHYSRESESYLKILENVKDTCLLIDYMINDKINIENNSSNETTNDYKNPNTLKEQIIEINELYKEGLITKEEYEQKKKKILDI